MKPARILLLVVAIVAGGLAAFLATRGQPPAPPTEQQATQVIQEARVQVLVAAVSVGVGQKLNPQTVMWQDWPEGALRPEYITASVMPDAIEQMEGTVARFEIFAGEPIRASKLVRTDQGYLSAVIPQGMRGVSIPVTAESGAGGFILPNDRVDVVSTKDEGNGPVSATILSNVKVLAIGNRLGQVGVSGGNEDEPDDPSVETFTDKTIATLELSPVQSEVVVAAASEGQLTLVLRSIVDFDAPPEDNRGPANQAITLIRGGTAVTVQSNAVASLAPNGAVSAPGPADLALQTVVQPLFEQAGLADPATETELGEVPTSAPARR